MTQATINGHTYSDDGTSARDMLHGGHRTWFIPMVGDVATVAGVVAGQAAQTSIDAASAADAAGSTRATSTTSLVVDAGTKNLVIQAGKQFGGGDYVTISRTSAPTTKMHGTVTSYSGTALEVEVAIIAGSGTYTDWTIALSGAQGGTGPSGDGSLSYLVKTGAYTITAADKAKLIDCTSGTFTLSFQACATLGANWTTYIRNSGPGIITLDPSSTETIDGSSTAAVNPGVTVAVQCNGTALRVFNRSLYGGWQFFHAQDRKAEGTDGGASVVGWQFRTLNTVITNTIPGASLASDAVTLPPGRYLVFAESAARGISVYLHLEIRNITDDSQLLLGVNSGASWTSRVSGSFSLTAEKQIKINHYHSVALSPYGLGVATSSGGQEVYTDVQIWRLP